MVTPLPMSLQYCTVWHAIDSILYSERLGEFEATGYTLSGTANPFMRLYLKIKESGLFSTINL